MLQKRCSDATIKPVDERLCFLDILIHGINVRPCKRRTPTTVYEGVRSIIRGARSANYKLILVGHWNAKGRAIIGAAGARRNLHWCTFIGVAITRDYFDALWFMGLFWFTRCLHWLTSRTLVSQSQFRGHQ